MFAPRQAAGGAYSGMWWMALEPLLQRVHPSLMESLEAASFQAFFAVGLGRTLLTTDWLDFSVEHVSRYFKLLTHNDSDDDDDDDTNHDSSNNNNKDKKKATVTTFDRKIHLLQAYLDQAQLHHRHTTSPESRSLMATASTLALVPIFTSHTPPPAARHEKRQRRQSLPTRNKTHKQAMQLEAYSLAVTLVSLWKIGIPRIVVASNTADIPPQVQGAFALFNRVVVAAAAAAAGRNESMPHDDNDHNATVVVYAQCVTNEQLFIDPWGNALVPRHAIERLQAAMQGNLSAAETALWLGTDFDHDSDHPEPDRTNASSSNDRNSNSHSNHHHNRTYGSRWKYIYFTEPDMILHTRPSALVAITEQLDQGNLLTAHRFQPLPHQVDYPDHPFQGELLPNFSFPNPLNRFYDLKEETDACCDAGNDWPGVRGHNYSSKANCPWYACGFRKRQAEFRFHQGIGGALRRHERLLHYPLIRLPHGLNIPMINVHGRICRPAPRGTCE